MSHYDPPVLHLLKSGDEWRRSDWPHGEREVVVVAQDNLVVVRDDGFLRHARPLTQSDWERLFGQLPPAMVGKGAILLAQHLPIKILTQAISFFRAAWLKEKREDILLIYFNYEQLHYYTVHPHLKAAGMDFVNYEPPDTPDDCVRFGSIHSHGEMPAFHSSTDLDDDLRSPGIHIVIGDVHQPLTSVYIVYVSADGHLMPVRFADVFQPPPEETYPADWLEPVPRTHPRSRRTTHHQPGDPHD